MPTTDTAVRREITVKASPERAFEVFAARLDTWWPRSYSIGATDMAQVAIEPRQGGRWYERGSDGSECVWGEVLTYDPPRRLTLTWAIGGDWRPDTHASAIDVTFTPTDGGTRVTLVHSGFEGHNEERSLRGAIGGDGGWTGLLAGYAQAIV
jgi:uncharacterized protein YndB with AHSA1/START domain